MLPIFAPPPTCRDVAIERSWTCLDGLFRQVGVETVANPFRGAKWRAKSGAKRGGAKRGAKRGRS